MDTNSTDFDTHFGDDHKNISWVAKVKERINRFLRTFFFLSFLNAERACGSNIETNNDPQENQKEKEIFSFLFKCHYNSIVNADTIDAGV